MSYRSDPSTLSAIHADVQPDKFILDKDICTLGRSSICDIVVAMQTISRLHAKIERDVLRYVLYDANSANGTFVNGHQIREPYVLRDQDLIGLSTPEPLLCFDDADPTVQIATGRLRYDLKTMTFFLNFRKLDLTPTEFRLLHLLYQYASQICTRERCAEAIWGREYNPELDSDALNRVVSNLRGKFKEITHDAEMIETSRGTGYVLHL